jgi:quercetin dioxygenase-like cupin family protein
MSENKVLPFPTMPKPSVAVMLWDKPDPPDEARLREQLTTAGYQVVGWTSQPHQAYVPHAHIYPELLWVVAGAVTLLLPVERRLLELTVGDRVELSPGTLHAVLAGADGASYLVATGLLPE